jgi:hypothetical protein
MELLTHNLQFVVSDNQVIMKISFITSALTLTALVPGFVSGVNVVLSGATTAHVNGNVDVSCDNKGPTITFSGIIAKDTCDATVTFSNNEKGTHTATEIVEATVKISTGDVIEFAKAPPLGGVGGNPHIFFLPDCDYDKAIYLGRCVQGGEDLNFDTILDYFGDFEVTEGDCSNNPGPFINLEGELILTANVEGCFVFKNNVNNPQHIRQEDGDISVMVTILEAGEKITIPKQPVRGGAGGNPLIYVKACGSEEVALGRCVQLGK